MRENRTSGTVRGVPGNRYPYRDIFKVLFMCLLLDLLKKFRIGTGSNKKH